MLPQGLLRHTLAAFGTLAAGIDASLHVTDPFAVVGALAAYFRALAAGVLVVLCTDQHEMGRGAADFGAGHHQLEVFRLRVLAALFESMSHRHGEALAVAGQTVVDALLHFRGDVVHGRYSFTSFSTHSVSRSTSFV